MTTHIDTLSAASTEIPLFDYNVQIFTAPASGVLDNVGFRWDPTANGAFNYTLSIAPVSILSVGAIDELSSTFALGPALFTTPTLTYGNSAPQEIRFDTNALSLTPNQQ